MCRGEDIAQELMEQFEMDLDATYMSNGHRLPSYAHSGLIMHGVNKFDGSKRSNESGWTINWKKNKDANSFSVAIFSRRTIYDYIQGIMNESLL